MQVSAKGHPASAEPGPATGPVLCVVITCYKQPGLLPEAVTSVLGQTVPCGIVLVNDGCPFAETEAFCLRVRSAYPERVLYLRKRNGGPASARNAGIDLALSVWPDIESILLVDGDNRLSRGTLERMRRTLHESGADWAFPDMATFGVRQLRGAAGEYSLLEQALRNYVDTSSLIARRVFDSGIRFDPSLPAFEDWDFWLQAAERGFRGTYVFASGFQYRDRPESLLRDWKRGGASGVTTLYSKHRRTVNLRTCCTLEHNETPRYACFSEDMRDVALFTDPALRGRRMCADDFVERLVAAGARHHLGRLPTFILTADTAAFRAFEERSLLHGLLWHMEWRANSSNSAVALDVSQSSRCSVRALDSPGGKAVLAMEPLELALYGKTSPQQLAQQRTLSSTVSIFPSLQLPLTPIFDAECEMRRLVEDIRARLHRQTDLAALTANDSCRRKSLIAGDLNALFGSLAIFPIASSGVRTGFLLRDDAPADVREHCSALAAAARATGHSTHLFWIRTGAIPWPLPPGSFETITPVSPAGIWSVKTGRALIGLFGTMHCIVNHGCPELLRLNGDLRQYGGVVAYALSESSHGTLRGSREFHGGVDFEYAMDWYICTSARLRLALHGCGVPERKTTAAPAEVFSGIGCRSKSRAVE